MNQQNKMKRILILTNVLILVFLIFQVSLTASYSSKVVWTDKFDDGNFDGWILSCIHSDEPRGWYADTETGVEVNDEEQLVFTSKGSPWHDYIDDVPGWRYNYTRLWRSTIVLNGSWSWDMYPGHQPCGAAFITKTIINPTSPISHTSFRYGYRVSIIPFNHTPEEYGSVTGLPFISIEKYTSTWDGTILGLYESTSIQNNSWYHINVTRNYNSSKLYLDGVLRINVTDPKPMEGNSAYWDLSTDDFFFQLNSHGGTRVDNITVVGDSLNGKNANGSGIVILISSFGVIILIRRKRER